MRIPISVPLLVAADQLAKHWAVARLKPAGSIPVIPGFFSLTYVENPGAAWGMLAEKQVFLIAFSFVTLGFLVWRRRQLFGPLWCGRTTAALLFGGILGNLIDRIRLSRVVDYLDFYWGRHHFPAFNIADSAICCGVFLFILTQWLHDRSVAGRES
jgi:signal peptidase II